MKLNGLHIYVGLQLNSFAFEATDLKILIIKKQKKPQKSDYRLIRLPICNFLGQSDHNLLKKDQFLFETNRIIKLLFFFKTRNFVLISFHLCFKKEGYNTIGCNIKYFCGYEVDVICFEEYNG